MTTARLTEHARERCEEMGISTKVAKRIVANPSLVLPDFQHHEDRRFIHSCDEPDYCVIATVADPPEIITVLYFSDQYFQRPAKEPSP